MPLGGLQSPHSQEFVAVLSDSCLDYNLHLHFPGVRRPSNIYFSQRCCQPLWSSQNDGRSWLGWTAGLEFVELFLIDNVVSATRQPWPPPCRRLLCHRCPAARISPQQSHDSPCYLLRSLCHGSRLRQSWHHDSVTTFVTSLALMPSGATPSAGPLS